MTDTTVTSFPLRFSLTPSLAARAEVEREDILADPGFGKHFTDHMVSIDWTTEAGWHDAKVIPYGPLMLDPAASVLHYAQEIFEGLKVYRHADGSLHTFRPQANGRRLQRSARRLALPELSVEDFVESLRRLVAVDGQWVPSAPETSLYLRPFMIANESFLGVRAAHKVGYYVIASPAGAYFAQGVAPVKIWLSTEYSRAGRGGAGPFGTSYLADLGAEVIKIENHKEGGDIGRSVGPHYFGPGDSQFFQTFNRNKKSITHRLSVGALSQQLPLRLMDDFISKLLRL